MTAEAVAFARYAMFGQVYWHHTYRAFKIMFHRMVWGALEIAYQKGDSAGVRKFREEFKQFVTPSFDTPAAQGILFPAESISKIQEIETAIVNEADKAVTRWFSERSGALGAELYNLIATRDLFKRLIVVSPSRQADKTFWDRLSQFSFSNKRNWQAKLALQKAFQEQICTFVEKKNITASASSVVTADEKNRFLAAAHVGCVLLVDTPPESKNSTALEFLIEEDRRKYKADEIRTGTLEASILWREMQKNFRNSIGKMRVFSHPSHAAFLSAFLHRSDIENILMSALQVAEGK